MAPTRVAGDGYGLVVAAALKGASKAQQVSRERCSFERHVRPLHSRKFAQFSREWFDACNAAFVEAMLANPTERPSAKPS